ncbi:hypothetical protein LCGC14_1190450 [marine sediment metagenome]|uniref:Outer membrane protein beta-barrel domain-containing protein n=1 Tax=marine sediment metagenome TaxID=412755 RepID=A0A0F9P291_9ZZZZ
MRTSITISTLLFCIAGIMAQDIPGKFRIGLSAGFENNMGPDRMAFDRYTGYSANYDKTNYRFGLNLEYALKKDLTINTAIGYSNRDFTGTYFCDVCDFEVPPGPEEVDFRFIEIPLTLKYYFLPGKIRLSLEAGLNNLLPLNDTDYYGITDNSWAAGLTIGGGLEYNLSRKLALRLITDYSNGITNLYKESDFKIKSLNFGIGIIKKI